jgi:thiol-disulfide isomerase/thioredoxin
MLLPTLALILAPCGASELFRDISYDAALTAADKEDKVVMVDFFTTWCGPCKKLDATTWKDDGVLAWADDNAVAVKIDAEKELDLAKRYKVDAYPTIVLLDSGGREIDRLVGYRDAPTFLDEVAQSLRGMDAVSRALRKLEGHEKEPAARQKYADALAHARRYEDALLEYLWCWDNGRDAPGYSGVRLTFLLNKIQRIGTHVPAARAALEERRDAAEEKAIANARDYAAVVDFVALDSSLKDIKRTFALYDRLKKAAPLDPKVRDVFDRELTPILVAEHRYQDALELIADPKAKVDASLKGFADFQKLVESKQEKQPEMAQAVPMMRTNTVTDCARIFEACLGAGRKDEAAQIADKILAFGQDGATCASLVTSAARAGAVDVARALGERAMATMADSEAAVVRTALAKLEKPN